MMRMTFGRSAKSDTGNSKANRMRDLKVFMRFSGYVQRVKFRCVEVGSICRVLLDGYSFRMVLIKPANSSTEMPPDLSLSACLTRVSSEQPVHLVPLQPLK